MRIFAVMLLAAAILLGPSMPAAAVGLYGSSIDAQSLRCNGDLATIGDSKASVLQKCGQPFFAESFCKPADEIAGAQYYAGGVPCELVDEWSYNPGPGQFITILRFEAGSVTSIRYGDRVKE